ncbi:MAG TPA: inositol monophosphatase [Patescibacteria group bacterium]|nr:inositol monophosphatase [Patescibacteria group bacterium]
MMYEKELAFAKDLAENAGKIMGRYFRAKDIGTVTKADHTPVTIADTQINDLVIKKVKETFQDHGVLGEENSFKPERKLIWVVDPIDGTAPYSLGIPVSTFSLALVDRADGQALVAVTYDPFLEEMYHATQGGGAFKNGEPIKTSKSHDFQHAYISLSSRSLEGEGYNYQPAKVLQEFRSQGTKVLSFVSFVYTANRVATGQLLVTIVGETEAWDIAACAMLIQEAGGVVTDFYGKKRRFDESGDGCIMAANKEVLNTFLSRIKQTA